MAVSATSKLQKRPRTFTLAWSINTYLCVKSGEYNVYLIASNPTTANAMVKTVTMAGLSGIEPHRAGYVNAVIATITGGINEEKVYMIIVDKSV